MIKTLRSRLEDKLLSWINVDRYLPIQIDITNACNLRCVHCYHPHHKNDGAIGLADWREILAQYDALVARLRFRPYVIICGGEPLLSPLFEPILSSLLTRTPAYRVSVLTNGTVHDSKSLDLLARFPDSSVQISIDGPGADQHDMVRGAGSFARSMNGIREYQRRGISVDLLAILSRRSAPLIGKFFDLALATGVSGMGFTRLIGTGHAAALTAQNLDGPLSPLELRAAYIDVIREAARTGVRTGTHAPLFHLLHPGLGRNGRFEESIVIDYRGNYLASSRSRLVLGNALNEGLENIFLNHTVIQSLRKRKIKVCGTCPHFKVCGGDRNAAYAHSGDFLGPDPGCWLPQQKTG